MQYHVCVGTHHKTGTVWMDSVFRFLAKKIDVPFVHIPAMNLREQPQELLRTASRRGPCIFFDTHSRFPDSFLQSIEFRGLHLLRHPKDVAISCARYHQFSREEWLHRPCEEYGGRTYQEMINSLPAFREMVLFELDNVAGSEIRDMANLVGRDNFMDVKYEDLIRDFSMAYWHEILTFLGFEPGEISQGVSAFYKKSIMFNKKLNQSGHVQNGRPDQWRHVFDRDLNARFEELFPGVPQKLGYPEESGCIPANNYSCIGNKGEDVNELRTRISQEARSFEPKQGKKGKNSPDFRPKHLSGLLVLQGREFVGRAHEVVLGRKPDEKEQDYYHRALLQGRLNRIDVLGRLRRSPEGKKRRVRLRGLYPLYGLQALARKMPGRLPLVAGLLRRLAALGTALVRAPAQEQMDFIQDKERNRLLGRIKELEKKQQDAERERNKFQEWCKQRLKSLEQDWVLTLQASRTQAPGEHRSASAMRQESRGDTQLDTGLPWSVYAGFEDVFRGPRAEVMQGLQVLAPWACNPELPGPGEGFAHQVLDLGCGRGEWLEILQENGVSALGLDTNPEFVSRCLSQGLEVVQAEALDYLSRLPENRVPVVSALHLIEHLAPENRYALLQECFRVLVPGGLALLETPNPRNILVGAGDFYRDPDHLVPVFPDTLEFLGRIAGFEDSAVYFFNPERTVFYPAADKRFDSLQDYVQVSRDFFWTGRKPA